MRGALPYVEAGENEVSPNRTWRIVLIDPKTGRFATPGQAGALRVWAYRDRPVYTFGGDKRAGEANHLQRASSHGACLYKPCFSQPQGQIHAIQSHQPPSLIKTTLSLA